MPVKKTIRRKKSTRRSMFAWSVTRAQRVQREMRDGVQRAMRGGMRAVRTHVAKPLARITASMDRPTVAAMAVTGAIVMALVVAGYRTMPAPGEHDVALTASDVVQGDGFIPTPAIADARPAQTTPVRAVTAETVTIAGCLAQDGDTFRLKDTTGTDAPRSRSWKSGFLRKSPASVEVVDASRRLKLTNHVGERISVTGTLVEGEMQVRSLRRVSASCSDDKPKLNA